MINVTYKSILLAGLGSVAMLTGAYAAAPTADAKATAPAKEVKADADVKTKVKKAKKHHKKHAKKHHHTDCGMKAGDCGTGIKPAVAVVGATDIKVSGFVKADFTHDAKQFGGDQVDITNAIYSGVYSTAYVPLDGERTGVTNAHAKATRLNVSATQPTECGDVKAVIEGDFMSNNSAPGSNTGGAYAFRPRHAYGQWNGWTVGHTNSNFVDAAQGFVAVDPNGLAETFRQAIVSYKRNFEGGFSAAVAVERPGTEFTNAMTSTAQKTSNGYRVTAWNSNAIDSNAHTNYKYANAKDAQPDVTGRIEYALCGGHTFNVRGVYRKLKIRNASTVNVREFDKNAYGLGASAHLNVMNTGKFSVQVNAGNGIGRYVADLNGQAAVFNDALNKLELQRGLNVVASYNQKFTEQFSGNLGYSYSKVSTAGALTDGLANGLQTGLCSNAANAALGVLDTNIVPAQIPTRSYTRYFANVLYSPTKPLTLGLEYTMQVRKSVKDSSFSERKATVSRVGFGAWYRF